MNFGIKRLIGKLTLQRIMADHEARRIRLIVAKRRRPDNIDTPPPATTEA